MKHIGFWIDDVKAMKLYGIAKRKGLKVSELLRLIVDDIIRREESLPGVLLDEETTRKYFNVSAEEISGAITNWSGVKPDSIMAHALAYARRQYPSAEPRKMGLFATLVEGFTTGVWSGFGQERDPLFQKAYDAVIRFVGGTPPNELGISFLPILSKNELITLTPDILKTLERIIFSSD